MKHQMQEDDVLISNDREGKGREVFVGCWFLVFVLSFADDVMILSQSGVCAAIIKTLQSHPSPTKKAQSATLSKDDFAFGL